MESGLVGRNNARAAGLLAASAAAVSMESGLVGRNNLSRPDGHHGALNVSQWSPA